jgi:hypothetical protein
MTRAIVINVILDVIVVVAIVGGLAWAIWSSHPVAESNRAPSRIRVIRRGRLPERLRRLTSSDVGA